MQERLVFLIGSPRSGSTLLSRLLGAHSRIFAPEEPHLITPIAHLGYYDSVEAAPYDPIITRQAARALVSALPHGEADYLTALRAYTDALYRGLLEGAEGEPGLLLDKTPAYALSLDFLARLYPSARYVVLTRHPIAIWSSFVDSFFDGDDSAAHAHNPLLERYVPAIARFIRTASVPIHRVRYENLVQEPEENSRNLCTFLDIDHEPEMVDYGTAPEARGESSRGLGDPTNVARETRPTTKSLSKWAHCLDRPARARRALSRDPRAAHRRRPRDVGLPAGRDSRRARADRRRRQAGPTPPADPLRPGAQAAGRVASADPAGQCRGPGDRQVA